MKEISMKIKYEIIYFYEYCVCNVSSIVIRVMSDQINCMEFGIMGMCIWFCIQFDDASYPNIRKWPVYGISSTGN